MRKQIFIIFISLFLNSCCEKNNKTIYEYSGIKVIRIDKCSKTTFYYQKGENKKRGKIWAEYSGINDGFKGYLSFEKNGKVTILSGDGYFQNDDLDTTLFSYKRIYSYNRPEMRENVCEIMLAARYEKENNKQSNSKINITYNSN